MYRLHSQGIVAKFASRSLDFAGGGPVHIASGWSALAYAFVLGKRKHTGEKHHGRAHNTTLVFLGTVLIWFGWFGFNVRIKIPRPCSKKYN